MARADLSLTIFSPKTTVAYIGNYFSVAIWQYVANSVAHLKMCFYLSD